eukprot:CAMPEP_0113476922 /NCGR_PEP_ID=MMETSP0014_2-20120614/19930_1 /TAXON_ID=2857 /ORGANISM="Nitzschia sp." /LENGTH=133 /DNA_ID=CAMNT_0000369977 /DNA_START=355 /DNA_END=752 /DNA_ORIENTATION=- /assembly_acc=CAM_ASM_000159
MPRIRRHYHCTTIASALLSSPSPSPPTTTIQQQRHRRYWTARVFVHDRPMHFAASSQKTRLFSTANNGDGAPKSSKNKSKQWDVGNYVSVPFEGPGIITEKRGGGWFSVELIDAAASDKNKNNNENLTRRGVV